MATMEKDKTVLKRAEDGHGGELSTRQEVNEAKQTERRAKQTKMAALKSDISSRQQRVMAEWREEIEAKLPEWAAKQRATDAWRRLIGARPPERRADGQGEGHLEERECDCARGGCGCHTEGDCGCHTEGDCGCHTEGETGSHAE